MRHGNSDALYLSAIQYLILLVEVLLVHFPYRIAAQHHRATRQLKPLPVKAGKIAPRLTNSRP